MIVLPHWPANASDQHWMAPIPPGCVNKLLPDRIASWLTAARTLAHTRQRPAGAQACRPEDVQAPLPSASMPWQTAADGVWVCVCGNYLERAALELPAQAVPGQDSRAPTHC